MPTSLTLRSVIKGRAQINSLQQHVLSSYSGSKAAQSLLQIFNSIYLQHVLSNLSIPRKFSGRYFHPVLHLPQSTFSCDCHRLRKILLHKLTFPSRYTKLLKMRRNIQLNIVDHFQFLILHQFDVYIATTLRRKQGT